MLQVSVVVLAERLEYSTGEVFTSTYYIRNYIRTGMLNFWKK